MSRSTYEADGTMAHNGFWKKHLSIELEPHAIEAMHQLNRFRVVDDDILFRSARYHDIDSRHLIMDAVDGQPADNIIKPFWWPLGRSAKSEAAGQTAHLAGQWLGHFHKWECNARVEPYDLRKRVNGAIANVELLKAHMLRPKHVECLLKQIHMTGADPVDDITATIHGDYKPSNLIVANHEVVGVDMEGFHRGHPLVDIGQFLAHILLSGSGSFFGSAPNAWQRSLCRSFYAGYQSVADCEILGLEFRILDATLAVLTNLARRHGRAFWLLKGQRLMSQIISVLLEKPILGGLHS